MKRVPITIAVSALLLWSAAVRAEEDDYFRNPPGCEWSSLLFTNAAAYCISTTPGGYVLAGQCEGPPGESGHTATVLALSLEGYPGHAYFFPGVASGDGHRDSGAFSIGPAYGGGGELEGYVVTGYRIVEHVEDGRIWQAPALWATKLDLGFYTVWERTLDPGWGESRWGNTVVWDPAGFYDRAGALVGGNRTRESIRARFHMDGDGMVTRLYSDGEVHWEVLGGEPGREWMGALYSVSPLRWGVYVFGTSRGICMTSSGLALQWTVQETNCFYSVMPTSDGGCIATGWQKQSERYVPGQGVAPSKDIVLTKVSAGGTVEWTRTFGLPEKDEVGHCFTTAPGGDFVLAGEAEKTGDSSATDAMIVRLSSAGDVRWELRLGGTNNAAAYSVVCMPGNYFLVAGEALGKMWLFKLRGNLAVPVPQFTCSPASPAFIGQEITFDASASSAPGGSIIDYSWDFGDGQTASGAVVRHTFQTPTNYPVCLTVTSSDGLARSATQTVEIIQLAVQWERLPGNKIYAITEARDGGFLLAGAIYDARENNDDLCLLKTDSRGRAVWDKSYEDQTCPGGGEAAYAVIRAPSAGYLVAGKRWCYNTRDDGWLLKVNETGDLEWANGYSPSPDNTDVFYCLTPLPDGGYLLGGYTWEHVYGDPIRPWLVRTDAEGHELESWTLPLTWKYYRACWVIPSPDASGYVVACGSGTSTGKSSILVTKVRTNQSMEWMTSLPSGPDYMEYGGRWVAAVSDGGFVVAGTATMQCAAREYRTRSCLVKLSATGNPLWTNFWPGVSLTTRSYGLGAAATPDGGYVVVGACEDGKSFFGYLDVAIRATDAKGRIRWAQTVGVTNVDESGLKVLALADGSYVVLGRCGERAGDPMRGSSWLFKLATNHPPVARIQASTNGAPIGETLTFDGSASSDRDGTVALHEWDFGDGQTAAGAIVSHSYTNSGTWVVRLAAVDDREAEGIALHTQLCGRCRCPWARHRTRELLTHQLPELRPSRLFVRRRAGAGGLDAGSRRPAANEDARSVRARKGPDHLCRPNTGRGDALPIGYSAVAALAFVAGNLIRDH
ncbi:MAG: PKD domain-containing protein [Verrucomicrobiota bacterium]|nr:PKD domain-containing protein [Verrucomicrobiota bacterium]